MLSALNPTIIPMTSSNDELSGIIHHTPWPLNAIGCSGTRPLCFVPGLYVLSQTIYVAIIFSYLSQAKTIIHRFDGLRITDWENTNSEDSRDLGSDFDELPQATHTPIDQTTYRNNYAT